MRKQLMFVPNLNQCTTDNILVLVVHPEYYYVPFDTIYFNIMRSTDVFGPSESNPRHLK